MKLLSLKLRKKSLRSDRYNFAANFEARYSAVVGPQFDEGTDVSARASRDRAQTRSFLETDSVRWLCSGLAWKEPSGRRVLAGQLADSK